MRSDSEIITTSISIKSALLEQAKLKAAKSYRTFSQYVSYLVDQDLQRDEAGGGRAEVKASAFPEPGDGGNESTRRPGNIHP